MLLAGLVLLVIGVVASYAVPTHRRFTGPLHDLVIPASDPNWEHACPVDRTGESRLCVAAATFDINLARRQESLPPLVLPRGFTTESYADQLEYLVNNERSIRGLTTFGALDPALDRDALAGARRARDPAIPGTLEGGSDWAGNFPNPIVVDFLWMYEDGFRFTNGGGGSNLDCQRADASGCWGHRGVILESLASGSHLGAAFTTNLVPSQASNYFASYAIVLTGEPAFGVAGSSRPVAEAVEVAGVALLIWGIASAALTRHRARRGLLPNPPDGAS